MPPTPSSGFTCSTCGRQYQHSNHLRRHEAAHLGSHGFKCQYCARVFKRRDVWRKHYTSCEGNNSHEEPPPAKRGKKPRACDPCFRSKVACDGGSPCSRCTTRRVACSYVRVQLNTDREITLHTPGTTNTTKPPSANGAPPAAPTLVKEDNTKIPVSFLLGLTNPEAESMVGIFLKEPSYDCDGPGSSGMSTQPETDINTDAAHDDASNDGPFFPWVFGDPPYTDLFAAADDYADGLTSFPESASPSTPAIDPTLAPTISALESLHTTLTSTDPSYTGTFDPALAAQVFTAANATTFLSNYFRHTHKHLPLLHRPSFNTSTTTPALVLIAFLTGALYAPPRDCVLATPRFFHIAEEFVFRKLEALVAVFTRGGGDGDGEEGKEQNEELELELYETLQAAVLIHGAQFIMNTRSADARRRGWMVRKPVLVDAVRRLGLTAAKHEEAGWVGGEEREEGWKRWVRDEMRIRIATWTLLTDWQESGVLHRAGLMTIYEMSGELPGLEELWEANDAAEFEAVVANKGRDCWRRSASVRDCVDAFMADPWSGAAGFPLQKITMYDLYICITAISVVIGVSRLTSLLHTALPALQRATDRWEELWQGTLSQLGEEELRMSGFVRHCGEFCWLAKAMLKHSRDGKDRTVPFYQRIGHDSPKELHDFVRALRGP